MKKTFTFQSAFFNLRVLFILLIFGAVTGTLLVFLHAEAPANISQRTLTFAERVGYQRAIEDVYWRHRIWPKERPDAKPSVDAAMPQTQLEKEVQNYLRKSQAFDYWQRPLTADQLQAEMDRMAQHTRQPEVLRELFEALGNDPFVIAECLARPVLLDRLTAEFSGKDKPVNFKSVGDALRNVSMPTRVATVAYVLPTISEGGPPCIDDTWTATSTTNAPIARRSHTAVWTGTEMIVWGGDDQNFNRLNTGGKYDPSTDSWSDTSTIKAPAARRNHTSVWTGTEMIVWGGADANGVLNTGGRYNPSTDSWTATTTTAAPTAREAHTAVWTGTEMIIWGGGVFPNYSETGGKYNPDTDTWIPTSTNAAPSGRGYHTAVWSGSEMIVWGGYDVSFANTGGRYNPGNDSWLVTSTADAPVAREGHTAVWTGNEMIIWGGYFSDIQGDHFLDTGGKYDPSTDTWISTSTTNAPTGTESHVAVWTQNEMIVWGGLFFQAGVGVHYLDTGGRYAPATDNWTGTSNTNPPAGRAGHAAIWTSSEMIIWGGYNNVSAFNTGGRYCAQFGATPTPTPTATATPIATPTARPVPTPRHRPTPAPRPTQ